MGNTWEPLGSAEIGGHEKHDWKMVNIPYACFFWKHMGTIFAGNYGIMGMNKPEI